MGGLQRAAAAAAARRTRPASKAVLSALERVFAREINGTLPFQSKEKIYQQLCDDGLVAPMTREFGGDRFGAITVSGWQLTHAGRLLYCSSCDEA